MTRKAILERANVLNAASLQANSAMAVVATLEEKRPDAVTATFKCGDCTTVFASEADTSPFCVACGSHHVHAETEETLAPEVLPEMAQLAAYVCASCGSYNVLSSANVARLKSHAHCVMCGDVQNFVEETTAEADDEQQGDQQADQDADQQQDQDKDKEESAVEDTTVDPTVPATPTKEVPAVAEATPAPKAPAGHAAPAAPAAPAGTPSTTPAVAEVDGDGDADDMAVETVPLSDDEVLQDEDVQQMDDTPVAVEMSLLSAALSTNPKAELELHHTGASILAMVGGLHVATLEQGTRAEFAGVFDKAPFAKSILQAAKDHGVVAALDSYGFTKTKVSVSMPKVTSALVAKGVATKTAELSAATQSLTQDLHQSLSIAAAALNKGFYKTKGNPLKTAVAQALSSLGVANPNRVVTNVFASAGDAYTKLLLETALELSGRSVEFRNELSASVQDMEVQSSSQDEEESDDGDHQFRAATAVSAAVSKGKVVSASAVPQVTSISTIRQSIGGSVFKRQ